MNRFALALLFTLEGTACKPNAHSPTQNAAPVFSTVSRSLALSADGRALWVVNPESDSISQIDLATRKLVREILLAPNRPATDSKGRYDPAIRPRAIALDDTRGKAYVAGQSANHVFVIDLPSGAVEKSIAVGAEPTALLFSADGATLFVINHQSATVQTIDPRTASVIATRTVNEHPWGASLSSDGRLLFVTHLLLNPRVTVIDTSSLDVVRSTPLPDQPTEATHNKLLPNGVVRGPYAVVPRPNSGELWIPHLLLAVDTPEPALDFQSTVFPTLTLLDARAQTVTRRLLFRPESILTAPGAFTDSVSGPRDVAFTPDGKVALVALAQSEDVMVFDATTGFETQLVRPIPSSLLEGITIDAAGTRAYVHGRGSHNISVLTITDGSVSVEGDPIDCLTLDPMPADLRRGMRLFYSANSSAFPITTNFWIACASCHLEGQTDAVTWKFTQGPRDTPSNAGGPINTGFLLRQAVRNDVVDYDETIRTEQGGDFHRQIDAQRADLKALADFTNYAIAFPQNPNRSLDGSLTPAQLRGQTLFASRCANCHGGDFFTDSASTNPTLDLAGPVLLHDVGTCVTTGAFPDRAAQDIDGHPRNACQFDTPTLRGIFATAPYFHDGSAATLNDVLARLPTSSDLGATDRADLVAYLMTL